jgi:hypothetical protein
MSEFENVEKAVSDVESTATGKAETAAAEGAVTSELKNEGIDLSSVEKSLDSISSEDTKAESETTPAASTDTSNESEPNADSTEQPPSEEEPATSNSDGTSETV